MALASGNGCKGWVLGLLPEPLSRADDLWFFVGSFVSIRVCEVLAAGVRSLTECGEWEWLNAWVMFLEVQRMQCKWRTLLLKVNTNRAVAMKKEDPWFWS
ncbi:hypothetical protein ACSQ67_023497 [Phaseolus vulgaris]